ncbi:MAG: hypothetical protein OSB43_14745 [Nocardioides sp.]|uniref:hypothetical protein n=1 Tax=Nocardioides sp. TaxID=35761 RepID=UPI002394C999|nr:hypothetical protein [Nocardioides sp.]MDE0777532.1 hypothetical protein [Nocardioides sp.]
MTGRLSEELKRAGDLAPIFPVAPDTYRRARRARRRDIALAVVSSVAAVALIVGIVTSVVARDDAGPLPADGQGPVGVPSVVHDIPSGADLGPASSDLAIGRGAVSQLTGDEEPVVIDDRGGYHLLDLPGFTWPFHMLSLSPDGRQLAWGWSETDSSARGTPFGVRIADLDSGEVRTISVEGSDKPFVYDFTWSPDSRWLVWEGVGAGRIAPGAITSEPVPRPGDGTILYAVDDSGVVSIATLKALRVWDGELLSNEVREAGWYPSISTVADGVLLETIQRDRDDTFVTRHRRLVDGAVVDHVAILDDRSFVNDLGWVDDRRAVVLTVDGPAEPTGHLDVLDLSDPTATTTVRVAEVRAQLVTVATDLLTPDRPGVERPVPPWLGDEDSPRSLILLAGSGALIITAVGVRWALRRRRRTAR